MRSRLFIALVWIGLLVALAGGTWYTTVVIPAREAQARRALEAEQENERARQEALAEMQRRSEQELRQIDENGRAQHTQIFTFHDAERMAAEGRWVDVGNYAIRWIGAYPKNLQAWILYGQALEQLNMNVPARDALLKAWSLRRGDPTTAILLVNVLLKTGDVASVSGYLAEANDAYPNDLRLIELSERWRKWQAASQAEVVERRQKLAASQADQHDWERFKGQRTSEGRPLVDCAASMPTIEAMTNCIQQEEQIFSLWRDRQRP